LLKAAGGSVKQVRTEGIVCLIHVSAADWTEPAQDAWSLRVRGGQRSSDGQTERYLHYGDWVAWAPTEQPEPYRRDRAAEVFADAIAAGRHCVGFALDPDWLPRDLVQAADYRLEMPVLTGKDVGLLAASLCGG
jgi:cell division protease FtsH